uniref:Uncharacterized protein n=1 Tax=viral metagenome TaxID=1070528 RepID=A0A6C0BM34_9ZZZZ
MSFQVQGTIQNAGSGRPYGTIPVNDRSSISVNSPIVTVPYTPIPTTSVMVPTTVSQQPSTLQAEMYNRALPRTEVFYSPSSSISDDSDSYSGSPLSSRSDISDTSDVLYRDELSEEDLSDEDLSDEEYEIVTRQGSGFIPLGSGTGLVAPQPSLQQIIQDSVEVPYDSTVANRTSSLAQPSNNAQVIAATTQSMIDSSRREISTLPQATTSLYSSLPRVPTVPTTTALRASPVRLGPPPGGVTSSPLRQINRTSIRTPSRSTLSVTTPSSLTTANNSGNQQRSISTPVIQSRMNATYTPQYQPMSTMRTTPSPIRSTTVTPMDLYTPNIVGSIRTSVALPSMRYPSQASSVQPRSTVQPRTPSRITSVAITPTRRGPEVEGMTERERVEADGRIYISPERLQELSATGKEALNATQLRNLIRPGIQLQQPSGLRSFTDIARQQVSERVERGGTRGVNWQQQRESRATGRGRGKRRQDVDELVESMNAATLESRPRGTLDYEVVTAAPTQTITILNNETIETFIKNEVIDSYNGNPIGTIAEQLGQQIPANPTREQLEYWINTFNANKDQFIRDKATRVIMQAYATAQPQEVNFLVNKIAPELNALVNIPTIQQFGY